MQIELSFIENLARQAGEILRAGFRKKIRVEEKGEMDLVTEIDRASEDLIVAEIKKKFPEHTIIAEESGNLPGDDSVTWFIDPLDGTLNYAHGFAYFCVSIACSYKGQMQFAVIYDPIQDECFSAQRGKGAWLNGEPISPSSNTELRKALLVTGFPDHLRLTENNNVKQFSYLLLRTQSIRRMGAAALNLCYVAAGRFDGYWQLGVKAWDIAAGTLIAEEAGVKVTSVIGEKDYMKPPYSLLVSAPVLYEIIFQALQESQADSAA
ncbi:MAG: inositol monophosphatase [Anaerolineaceae bacterium]|nr:inositol monophosphatase [Anaerolineaceae bacterium]